MGSTNNTASQGVAGAAQSARGNNASFDTTPTPAAPPPPTPSTLSGSVGINAQNNSDDVWQVSSRLAANGYLDAPTRDATPEMQSKIITAQQDMSDLKPDGLVNPGGPTETRFQQLAGQGFMKAPSQETAFGKSPAATPNPSEVKDGTTAKAFARMQQDKQDAARAEASEDRQRQDAQAVNAVKAAKTDQKAATMMAQIQAAASTKAPASTKPESLLPHKDMLREGQDEGQRNGQTAPDIGADAFQSNQRTAEFVKSRNTLGDLTKFTADAINSDDEDNSEKAIHEVSNLIHQIAETDPAKAQDLLHRTRKGLTPERRDMFERILDPGRDPDLDIWRGPATGEVGEIITREYDPKRDGEAIITLRDDNATNSSQGDINKGNLSDRDSTASDTPNKSDEPEWPEKPSDRVFGGTNRFNVNGPIKIDPSSVTPGEGSLYEVDWYALDKNGEVIPEWRSNDHKPEVGGGHNIFGLNNSRVHYPPRPNKYGYQVIVRVPPQAQTHGNGTGVHLDIYSPKGNDLKKVRQE